MGVIMMVYKPTYNWGGPSCTFYWWTHLVVHMYKRCFTAESFWVNLYSPAGPFPPFSSRNCRGIFHDSSGPPKMIFSFG